MSAMHESARMLLGAYVLGGLSEGDRWDIETHLPTCGECREELVLSAPLAGLLRRAPDAFADSLPALATKHETTTNRSAAMLEAPPMSAALDRLLRRMRAKDAATRRRTSRLRRLALAAAVIAVIGMGIGYCRGAPKGPGRTVRWTR